MKSLEPMRPGATGRALIQVAKDRPGAVRATCTTAKGGLQTFADFVCDSTTSGNVTPHLYVPRTNDEQKQTKRSELEAQIITTLRTQPGMGKREMRTAITGKDAEIDAAVSTLIQTGRLTVRRCGAKTQHHLPEDAPTE